MLCLLQDVLEMMASVMTLVMSLLKTVPNSLVPREELCKNQSLVKTPNELQTGRTTVRCNTIKYYGLVFLCRV